MSDEIGTGAQPFSGGPWNDRNARILGSHFDGFWEEECIRDVVIRYERKQFEPFAGGDLTAGEEIHGPALGGFEEEGEFVQGSG